MPNGGSQFFTGLRSVVAALGIILMFVSMIWLQSIPREPAPSSEKMPTEGRLFPVVVLDPGHGGQDSGAICGGLMEKDLTLDIAQRVDQKLQAQGLAAVMTRVGDAYVSLADRVALTNRVPNSIFVSIHFNEGNKPVSSGIETYYAEHQITGGIRPIAAWLPFLRRVNLETPNLQSQSLAGFIQQSLLGRTHAIDRGVKAQQFFVLANVRHPAVLVEGGFMTNKDDIARLNDPDYREQLADAICDGVIRYRKLLQDRVRPSETAGGDEAE